MITDLELSFSNLSYDVILLLEEALKINKSLGNMTVELLHRRFVNGIVLKIACSKRSDSGERCELGKAREKTRGD